MQQSGCCRDCLFGLCHHVSFYLENFMTCKPVAFQSPEDFCPNALWVDTHTQTHTEHIPSPRSVWCRSAAGPPAGWCSWPRSRRIRWAHRGKQTAPGSVPHGPRCRTPGARRGCWSWSWWPSGRAGFGPDWGPGRGPAGRSRSSPRRDAGPTGWASGPLPHTLAPSTGHWTQAWLQDPGVCVCACVCVCV